MARDVETLSADQSIAEAVATLSAGRHRVYPVIDRAERPVGLVTRADALRWELEGAHEGESVGEHVSDASLPVVHPGDVVSHAVDVMLAADQGRIPVTEPTSGKLVGLLTRKDLLLVRTRATQAESERRAYFRALLARR